MSALLGIVLSLCLIYLVFAVVVSGIQEWIAQWRGSRGQYLRLGLSRLINDEAIFIRLLHHPLVGGLYRDRAVRGKPPSYVASTNFALALANLIVRRGNPPQQEIAGTDSPQQQTAWATTPLTCANLRAALQNLAAQRSPLASALLPVVDSAQDDLAQALKGIEQWYSSGMDRVSGWYKAHAQKSLFLIGLLVAVLGNVDTIAIFQTLNRSADLRAQLSQLATEVARSGKIGDVDVATLHDRPPTNAEWQRILTTSLDATETGALGRLPIGYSCLRALATVPSTESGRTAAGGLPSASAEARKTAVGTPTVPMAEVTGPPANERGSASVSPNANPPSIPAASNAMDKKGTPPKSAWGTCVEQISAIGRGSSPADLLLKLIGYAITAFAGVLGAPYWFSALSRIVQIRGSGPKPAAATKTSS